MQQIFFSSDLHFGHRNIVKYTNRGIETTQENHDEWLMDLWSDTITPGAIVYLLGDFSFHKNTDTTINILNKLKGNKVLLKGNHDYSDNFERYTEAKQVQTHQYLEKKFGKNHVVMFHFPIGSFHKQSHGSWHLHGHSHGNYGDTRGKMLDVGLDQSYNMYGKHQFFSLDMIEEYMQEQEIYVADNHRGDRSIDL